MDSGNDDIVTNVRNCEKKYQNLLDAMIRGVEENILKAPRK